MGTYRQGIFHHEHSAPTGKRSVGPHQQIYERNEKEGKEPEPQEDEDLLGEHVDHQDTLDGVRTRLANITGAQVAKCYLKSPNDY